MADDVPTFRVSPSYYLRFTLWQGALGGLGMLLGWGLFLLISFWSVPVPIEKVWRLHVGPMTAEKWSLAIRESVRFGIGPCFLLVLVLSTLIAVLLWMFVRYEIHPESLRKCWGRFSRQVEWELIQSVEERPHRIQRHRSLRIGQDGSEPIVVTGLEAMTELAELLRSRLPRLSKWTIAPVRIDISNAFPNLVIGFLFPLPFIVTWVAYYVVEFHSMGLVWSAVLVPVAYWIWFHRPISRSHQAPREAEMMLALILLAISGCITGMTWFPTLADFIDTVSVWFGY